MKPLLQQRNDAYKKWLATEKMEDLSRFKEARNVRKAIRNDKNSREGAFWWEGNVRGSV